MVSEGPLSAQRPHVSCKRDRQHWNLTEEGLGLGTQCVRSGACLSRNLPLGARIPEHRLQARLPLVRMVGAWRRQLCFSMECWLTWLEPPLEIQVVGIACVMDSEQAHPGLT